MESEFLVEALGSNSLSLINIDDLPSLVGNSTLFVVFVSNYNLLSFLILRSFNFKYLIVVWVDEVFSLKLEDLEPMRVGAPDSHVVGTAI